MFCESFGASYGDISIVVATPLLRGDIPLLSEHDYDDTDGHRDGVRLLVGILVNIMRAAEPGKRCESP